MAITYNPYGWEIRKNPQQKTEEKQLEDLVEQLAFRINGLHYHGKDIKGNVAPYDLRWITEYATGLEQLIYDIAEIQAKLGKRQ